MKRLHTFSLIILLLASTMTGWGAAPEPTPNAAVYYMTALGLRNEQTEKAVKATSRAESFEKFKKIPDDSLKLLEEPTIQEMVELLKKATEIPFCQFTTERMFLPDDSFPPVIPLSINLAGLPIAVGFKSLKEGKPKEALEIFHAALRLGQAMEEDGAIIVGLYGMGIKRDATAAIGDLLKNSADESVKQQARNLLKEIPSSIPRAKAMLACERNYLEKALDLFSSDPEAVPGWQVFLPLTMKNRVHAGPVMELCQTNQRRLLGALEFVLMDNNDVLPASLPREILPSYLVEKGYLKKLPVCPDGGIYYIDRDSENNLIYRCTKHPLPGESESNLSHALEPKRRTVVYETEPTPYRFFRPYRDRNGTPTPAAEIDFEPSKEDIENFKQFVNDSEFSEWRKEALALQVEGASIDHKAPDFPERLNELQNRIKAASETNPVVKYAVTDMKDLYMRAINLDYKIADLLTIQ